MMTLLERLQILPPVVVRLCARTNGRMASGTEIAARSGLSCDWVCRISRLKRWPDRIGYGADVVHVSRFLEACGVDIFKPEKTLKFVKMGLLHGFKHIEALRHGDRQRRQLYPYAISLMSGVREWRTSRKVT